MPTYVALLRAVNLGGSTQIAMSALRTELERLGMTRVRSLLQSGNLVFDARTSATAPLERRLEEGVARDLAFRTEFFVRSTREWATIVADNPFPQAAEQDPGHLLLTVLKEEVAAERWTALAEAIPGRERVVGHGRQGYFVYPDGVGRSKVSATFIERHLASRGTSRNWNTVGKIQQLLGG